ncbi:MAG: site-2 protease family protein [Planctomycetes bacterium]|nr:site-2 protease family protein [Planctomycetota bacterium]
MNFLGGAVKLGRLFDVTIRVHVLFFVLMGYWLITAGAYWQSQLAFCVMLFTIVLVHEFGHCLGARAVGGYAHDILMWPLGGLAYASAPMRPWPQFVTVACGPLVNVVFCIVSAAVLMAATGTVTAVSPNPFAGPSMALTAEWQGYVWLFFRVNYILLCFNLLPVFPLDGGQLFRSIIWPIVGLRRATLIAAQMGIAGAILLGIWGVTGQHFIMIGIAIFGGMTSYQHLKAAQHGALAEDDHFTTHALRQQSAGKSWRERLFGGHRRPARPRPNLPREPVNPNPGGWEAKLNEHQRLDAEVDRILRKVHDHGIQSLSYVERQALERATRERQEREREFERNARR